MPDYNAIDKAIRQTQQTPTPTNVNELYPTLATSEISSGGRYPVFHYGLNNEDIYGRNQTAGTQLFNGVVKGLGTAGTTFVGGTVGLVNGIYRWMDDGKFSSFYDNDLTRGLDDFNQGLENEYANYKTQKEIDAKWYSRDTWGTANFWGDTIIKNTGFAAGAIASGLAWGKVGSAVGAIAKGFASGVGAEIGANTAIESALLTRQAGGIEALTADASGLASRAASFEKIKDIGGNVVRAGMATFGEASIEAMQAKTQYKDTLTREYQNQFGKPPEGDAAMKIEQEADKVGNTTMGANVALLTATNYIQFPKILGTAWKAERNAMASGIGRIGLVNEAGEVVSAGSEQAFRQGIVYASRALDRPGTLKTLARAPLKVASALFAGSEAFEEGAQYVIPIAAQDYFDKGRRGEAQDIAESLRGGVKELFNTKEGMISILAGGLTGGLMKTLSPFSPQGLRQQYKNRGLQAAKTQTFVDALNGSMMGSGYMNQAIQSLNRAELLASEGEQALANNNRLQYEDTRTDQILNYMLPRIQYGRYDLIQDDLMGMRNVASTAAGYADLVKNGFVAETTDRLDFIDNTTKLMALAEETNANYKALHERYSLLTDRDENGRTYRKYNEDVLGKMAYVGAKINDYNKRIPGLLQAFNDSGINISELMSQVHTGGIGTETGVTQEQFNEVLDQIEALRGVSPELKDEMRENAADLIELSARREFKIREYEQMRANPAEWEEEAQKFSVAEDGMPDMSKVNFNEAEPEENPGDHEAIYNMVVDQVNGIAPTDEQTELREKYPNLYEQLTGTVDASWAESRKRQAMQEGWFMDSNGDPVAPTSKSDFFRANEGDYTMAVNGIDREGTLGYDPDTNSLFFSYQDAGQTKQVEVFNEDFNDSVIRRDGGTVDTGYLSEEDTAAPNRVQVRIRNLITEVAGRQAEIAKQVTAQVTELNNIKQTIQEEEKDVQKSTKEYVETMSTLSDMRREVEENITQLTQERIELSNTRAELQGLLQNVPLTLRSSKDLMERQQADLESLANHNGLLIPALQNLANSAKTMLDRFGKKLISRMSSMAGIPPSPNFNRVRTQFERWQQSGTDEDLGNAVTALQQEYQAIQNFEVRPLPASDIAWLNARLVEAQDAMKGIDARVRAKATVAERLRGLADQVMEREEIVKATPAQPTEEAVEALPTEPAIVEELAEMKKTEEKFKEDRQKELEYEGKTSQEAQEQAQTEWAVSTEGQRTEALQEAANAPEVFGDDSERTPISRYFNATSLLPKEMRNKSYDQRMNIFLNKIGIFPKDRRTNLRLLAITRANEASFGLQGFVDQYFKVTNSFDRDSSIVVGDENAVDAPIGMVLVEMVDGKPVFIDQNGAQIPEETADLVGKVLLTKMKRASLKWNNGETAYSDPTGLGEAFANSKREQFEEQRKRILAADTPQYFTFHTSQGRQRESSATESPSIVGNLITEEQMKAKKAVIEVIRPDKGKDSKVIPGIEPGETVQVKKGAVLLRSGDTLQKLFTRKLTTDEREVVKQALSFIVENRENANETLNRVRFFLEGSTFLKLGNNLESVTIGQAKFNLTTDALKGQTFQQVTATMGLENVLGTQNTNVREGFINQNRPFFEMTGMENGQPQFREWPTYQEFLLSTEGGRQPKVYAPIMVDKYLIFSPAKSTESAVKPPTAPEVVADRQAAATGTPKTREVIKGQSDLIKTITTYFTRANEEGLGEAEKAQEKDKANAAAAVILRMATVMVERGKYESVAEVYKSINFTNLYEKLNAGALNQTAEQKTVAVDSVEDYTDASQNSFRPNEQLRFAQGDSFEAVILVGDPDMLELSSLAAKDRKARSAKNPLPLSGTQQARMKSLEQQLGINGIALNDRLKEIAKENRSSTVEKIVRVSLPAPSNGTSLKAGDTYKDANGQNRVWGEDIEADKAYEIYKAFQILEEVGNIAGARRTAEQLAKGETVIFRNPEAVRVAQTNEYYNVQIQEDGSALVLGAFNPETMVWEGVPRPVEPGITVETAPESVKGAISMIEGGQAIIYAATGTADISTVLHEVAHFFEANALTTDEATLLKQEADAANNGEATPTQVSEFFARGFERYLRDETAPEGRQITQTIDVRGQGSKLAEIFKRVRNFLVEIYDTVVGSGIDIQLSVPMKQMYQDMLGIGFAVRETKRKGLSKDNFPKSLVGESFASETDTRDFVKGRNYKIFGANSGSTVSMTVTVGETSVSVPKGQVAVRDSITKEIKVVDIASVISQISDEETVEVVKKERQARKPKAKVVEEQDAELTGEIVEAPLPPQEIVAVGAPIQDLPAPSPAAPEVKTTPAKTSKLKAPPATVDGVKVVAGPEDVNGGIFLKDGNVVYVLPYFGSYVQVDEFTYKAYQKAATAKAPTVITRSRTLGSVKKGSTVTVSEVVDGVEKEGTYEVLKYASSSLEVRNIDTGEVLEVNEVSMKTGEAKAREATLKTAFLNKYVGETFKDINNFLNPNPTTIQDISLPDLNIKC